MIYMQLDRKRVIALIFQNRFYSIQNKTLQRTIKFWFTTLLHDNPITYYNRNAMFCRNDWSYRHVNAIYVKQEKIKTIYVFHFDKNKLVSKYGFVCWAIST